jgi:hypothetical protein
MPTTVHTAKTFLLTLAAAATLTMAATAQTTAPNANSYLQSQPAPIERAAPALAAPGTQPGTVNQQPAQPAVKSSQPAPGVWLRVNPQGAVTTVSATPERLELRVDSGIANITVHHPAKDHLILIDVAGGQLDLIKDGLYTVNADTKTARVLVGEAEAFPNTDANADTKPVKVKEDHAITFGTAALRTVEFEPFQANPDLLPRDVADNHGDRRATYPAYGYGYGPYDGYYGYPYAPFYAWDSPYYGWGYPYGFGLGFGYYGGGFYGGRGFYGGGFRGGGFRGRR